LNHSLPTLYFPFSAFAARLVVILSSPLPRDSARSFFYSGLRLCRVLRRSIRCFFFFFLGPLTSRPPLILCSRLRAFCPIFSYSPLPMVPDGETPLPSIFFNNPFSVLYELFLFKRSPPVFPRRCVPPAPLSSSIAHRSSSRAYPYFSFPPPLSSFSPRSPPTNETCSWNPPPPPAR